MAWATSVLTSFAAAGFAAVVLATIAGAGGCGLAVSDTVPTFACQPGPDTCPSDSICAPGTGQCVLRSQACSVVGCPNAIACDSNTLQCSTSSNVGTEGGSDATGDDAADSASPEGGAQPDGKGAPDTGSGMADTGSPQDSGGVPDTGADSPGACRGLACKCSGPSDCASGICGDQLSVTSQLYAAAGSASFCTQPCCSSADCSASTVCFGSGAGGNYCVRPEWLGRSTQVGSKIGGATCATHTECRSGLCAGSGCADTCCSSAQTGSECAAGSTCRFGPFPSTGFDTHNTAACGTSTGTGVSGSLCGTSASCRSGLCDPAFRRCDDTCRSTADCGVPGQACRNILAAPGGSDIVAACVASTGTGAEGASCTMMTDCQSAFCDPTSHLCTDVCFGNSDCTKSGWRCRPEVVTTVQGGGSYSVLCCGS